MTAHCGVVGSFTATYTLDVSTLFWLVCGECCTSLPVQLRTYQADDSGYLQLPHLHMLEQGTLHGLVQTTHSCKETRLLAVMLALLCVQERTAAPGQSEQQEDEEKAALRQHIQQLQDAAATGEGTAVASQATDQERLEAALQQERLQARIRQLEVTLPPLRLSCWHAAHAETVLRRATVSRSAPDADSPQCLDMSRPTARGRASCVLLYYQSLHVTNILKAMERLSITHHMHRSLI